MKTSSKSWLRGCLLAAVYALGIMGIIASGGGGGSSSSDDGDDNGGGGSGSQISRFGSANLDDPNSKFSTDSPFVWDTSTFQ